MLPWDAPVGVLGAPYAGAPRCCKLNVELSNAASCYAGGTPADSAWESSTPAGVLDSLVSPVHLGCAAVPRLLLLSPLHARCVVRCDWRRCGNRRAARVIGCAEVGARTALPSCWLRSVPLASLILYTGYVAVFRANLPPLPLRLSAAGDCLTGAHSGPSTSTILALAMPAGRASSGERGDWRAATIPLL